MRILSVLFFFVLFISCNRTTVVQLHTNAAVYLYEDVAYLASDELEGRSTGSRGEQLAADYIIKRFKEMGVAPRGDNGGYIQSFKAKDREAGNPHSKAMLSEDGKIVGKNVIGFIDHGAPTTVVLGAHYDHLGMGDFGSLHVGDPAIHNGADDNASGVAAVLALAERLKNTATNNNYLFILFSGEERGLWGSNFFTKNPSINLEKTNYMFNFDMVGRLNDTRTLAINGTGTSPTWDSEITKANKAHDFKIVKSESGLGPSDHSSFYLNDIPAIHFFTGQHEDYHKPSDDTHKVNFKGLEEIVRYSLRLIEQLDDDGKLEFTKTKDETVATPDFKVTLGVMPDYLYDGQGMRIDGVKEGRPAFEADMMAGDVVIQIGDLKVTDMMSYMKALGAFDPGQTVDVVIKRNGKEIMKKVTF